MHRYLTSRYPSGPWREPSRLGEPFGIGDRRADLEPRLRQRLAHFRDEDRRKRSALAAISSAQRRSTPARSRAGSAAQSGRSASAASMAATASAAPISGSVASTVPLAGLSTSNEAATARGPPSAYMAETGKQRVIPDERRQGSVTDRHLNSPSPESLRRRRQRTNSAGYPSALHPCGLYGPIRPVRRPSGTGRSVQRGW